MLSSRLSVPVLLLLAMISSAHGQEQQSYVVWGSLPTCGAKNLSEDSGPAECSRMVVGDVETYRVKHGKLSISLTYWWYAAHLRISTEIENGHDEGIPATVTSWFVDGYQSFETFARKEKPLFRSQPKSPDDSIGLPGRVPVGVPSSVSGTLPDGGGDPSRSIAPIPVVVENKRPSALKWKEIPPRSKQSGQLRFDTDPKG